MYLRTSDPFIARRAAATTPTSRVGTGVALVAVRDPVIAAKTIATLDRQSAGRLELGVGYGWNEEEMADDAQVTVYSSAGSPHDIERYQPAGVKRVVCWLPPVAERDLMANLDELTTRLEPYKRGAGS